MKFKALVSFSHGTQMFNIGQFYEFDNEELLTAWVDAGYAEIAKEPKATKKVKVDK